MGRHSPSRAYGHSVRQIGYDFYRIAWVVDRYYPTSRGRHPTRTTRNTDKAGAIRFCKKHGLPTPTAQEET